LDSVSRYDGAREVPDAIASECRTVADSIREDREALRYDKIQAARMRISSGFYDSGHVLSRVASRLIEEGTLG